MQPKKSECSIRMTKRLKDTVTLNEIPKKYKNEWGYPLGPRYNKSRTKVLKGGYRYMGYVLDRSRYRFLKKGDHDESIYED